MEFGGEFLATKVEFPKRDDLCLVGVEQPLTLSFEALMAVLELRLLGCERSHILLFRLRPRLVKIR